MVHHQYPNHHWTKHPNLYEKHKKEYAKNQGSVFHHTHALHIWFCAITQNYDRLAELYIDLNGKLTLQQKKQLIIERLQSTINDKNADTKKGW